MKRVYLLLDKSLNLFICEIGFKMLVEYTEVN